MTTDLVPGQPEQTAPAMLFRSQEPEDIVRQAGAVARALAPVIEDRGLYTDINGRRHVRVEGWTLLGSMLGVFPICVWSRPTDNGWEARVEARTLAGALVGAAEASCTRDEPNWRDKPDYALRSMSQTRATSKALRLPLGFVVALAGYEATPAEEAEVARVRSGARMTTPNTARAAQTLRIATERAEERPIPPATEAQVRAIYAIARGSHGLDDEEVESRCRERFGIAITGLNRRQASEFIDALKSRP
jgi:hypothetical protein